MYADFQTWPRGNSSFADLTPGGLVRHLSAMWHPPTAPPGGPPPFTFIAREDVARSLRRFGSDVARFAYYKVRDDGADHWITLLLTVDGRIADYEAY